MLNIDWKPAPSPSLARLLARDEVYAEMTAVTNALIDQATKHPLHSAERQQLMDRAITNAAATDRTMAEML